MGHPIAVSVFNGLQVYIYTLDRCIPIRLYLKMIEVQIQHVFKHSVRNVIRNTILFY